MKRNIIPATVLLLTLLAVCGRKPAPIHKELPTVDVGGAVVSSDIAVLDLSDGAYIWDNLLAAAAKLTEVRTIELGPTVHSAAQIDALRHAFPQTSVHYTTNLFGQTLDSDVTALDLSSMAVSQTEELLAALPMLPKLQEIEFVDADGGCVYGLDDIPELDRIRLAFPDLTLHVSFDLFGQTVSSRDERIEYYRIPIGNEGVATIRAVLPYLASCNYFLMDGCGVDNEIMAQLRADFPNTEIVWRVYFARYNCLTDVKMIHCTSQLTDENTKVLNYCNDVVYLDIGHNTGLSDLSFVNQMPKIKIAIVVDCATPDVVPFGNCPDLEWLEIVNCRNITDLSPLANCTKLKGMNMSGAFGIKDLSPLLGLQHMERLYLGRNALPEGQYEAAKEALSDCWVSNTHYSASNVSLNYAIGWRLDENGERAQWYQEIRKIFRYDENYYNCDD